MKKKNQLVSDWKTHVAHLFLSTGNYIIMKHQLMFSYLIVIKIIIVAVNVRMFLMINKNIYWTIIMYFL